MPRDTGFPRADAEADFLRARRHQVAAGLAARVRGRDGADRQALSFQEVVDALGFVREQHLGTRVVPVDRIVGSVDKVRDFDPQFRPRSGRSRQRWERIAEAARRGEPLPPIDVYQVGDMYFVRDGHHRVSVFRALDLGTIEADIWLVHTLIEPTDVRTRADLTAKELRRVLLQRVPLPRPARTAVRLTDPREYPRLAEMVEAWAARQVFAEGTAMTREGAARRWYEEEFAPVTGLIEEGALLRRGETAADAYVRVARERYSVFLDHVWSPEVIDTLRRRG